MADMQWYYARNDEPFGPVSVSDLKQLADVGELKPDDLLWREGMDEWTTAINLRGLFGDESLSDKGILAPAAKPGEQPAAGRPRPPAPARASAHARLQSLVRATQTVVWIVCVLVVLAGIVLFTRAFMNAKGPTEEGAAAAVFGTFFIGAYVLARCGEKLSRLLLAHSRRRSK